MWYMTIVWYIITVWYYIINLTVVHLLIHRAIMNINYGTFPFGSLFLDEAKVTSDVKAHLAHETPQSVTIHDYSDFDAHLETMVETCSKKIWVGDKFRYMYNYICLVRVLVKDICSNRDRSTDLTSQNYAYSCEYSHRFNL